MSKICSLVVLLALTTGQTYASSHDCPPPCNLECLSGLRVDARGCPICKCNDPCEYSPCGNGTYCESKEVQCVMQPCYDEAECVDCDSVCEIFCESGFRQDYRGCPLCQCIDPCEHNSCPEGQRCIVLEDSCEAQPCYNTSACIAPEK